MNIRLSINLKFINYTTIIKYRSQCHAFQTWIYWKSFLNLHEFVFLYKSSYRSSFKYMYVNEWVIPAIEYEEKYNVGNWSRKVECNIQYIMGMVFIFIATSKQVIYTHKKSWVFWWKNNVPTGLYADHTCSSRCIYVKLSYWEVICYVKQRKWSKNT